MKIELPTHLGLLIENFEIEFVRTVDYAKLEKFQPIILITAKNINIIHECEIFDYVNGTWTDEDVNEAVNNYLLKLSK